MSLAVLDLFSGIGGFSIGLERAGFHTVAFCEADPFCRLVLARHWPEVPCYDDVRSLTADRLHADGIVPEIVCGGFPCQDISFAGAGAGLDGARSGLWTEFARLIGELRPRYAIVENVAALLVRGLDRVLGELAALGYDAEWHCIPASAVGAPHRRDRIWIVAYHDGERRDGQHALLRHEAAGWVEADLPETAGGCALVADAPCTGRTQPIGPGGPLLRAGSSEHAGLLRGLGDTWLAEPDVDRVADGVPARVDRLRALGNAVVPQIPELIGLAIHEHIQALDDHHWRQHVHSSKA